jgi:RNA polymerase subunit RPABC4/transcription elongation factor Spt4
MRRRRECTECGRVVNVDAVCPVCGSKNIKWVGVKEQILTEPLDLIANPYRSGISTDPEEDETDVDENSQIPIGTKIPYYLIRQLPYIPKRHIKVPKEIYGLSEVQLHLESQDSANKFLNKAEKKSAKSKAYVTKLGDTHIDDEDTEIAYVEVESAQEASAMQVKQVMADINQEMIMASYLYDGAKSTAGVTDTDQGKSDPSARSGKAKQLQMAASQSRQQSPQKQRNVAYAGVYELIFKYLLAYCDEQRSFISLLPNGTSREEVWSKYMFLDTDKDGNFYYRDDFAWSVDEASEITQDRASMWQLIDNDFMNGTMGSEIDPVRALRMYWHMKDQVGYPTAKFALAFLEEAIKELPTQVEQALVNNPEAVQLALSYIADMQGGKGGPGQQGGARDGAGKPSSGQSHTQQQNRTNNESRAAQGQQTNTTAAATGGMQGGTK